MPIPEPTEDRSLVLTRVLVAPRSLVFKAWTDPMRAAIWWGPRGFTTLSCQMDVRPGGVWRIRMQSPQGTVLVKGGVYRDVVPPERLVFTRAWEDAEGLPGHETLVTIGFEAFGSGTKLTLHQAVFESTTARDLHHEGWSSCLERFVDFLAET